MSDPGLIDNTTQINTKNRIIFLEIARVFAIVSVVLCHAVEYIYQFNNIQSHIALSIQAKLFKTIVFTIGRLGVPIFLMISGYLLLNRNYENDESVKIFIRKIYCP